VTSDILTSVVCAALPESIGNLQNLTELNASSNQIESKIFLYVCPVRLLTSVVCAALPESIGNLQNLTTLYANRNQIESKFPPLCSTS
jgi:Leucine-rich repeat (LRR) protein